jgi:hypothetical protein
VELVSLYSIGQLEAKDIRNWNKSPLTYTQWGYMLPL